MRPRRWLRLRPRDQCRLSSTGDPLRGAQAPGDGGTPPRSQVRPARSMPPVAGAVSHPARSHQPDRHRACLQFSKSFSSPLCPGRPTRPGDAVPSRRLKVRAPWRGPDDGWSHHAPVWEETARKRWRESGLVGERSRTGPSILHRGEISLWQSLCARLEDAPHDLAGTGLGERLDENYLLGAHDGSEVIGDVVPHLVGEVL